MLIVLVSAISVRHARGITIEIHAVVYPHQFVREIGPKSTNGGTSDYRALGM